MSIHRFSNETRRWTLKVLQMLLNYGLVRPQTPKPLSHSLRELTQ